MQAGTCRRRRGTTRFVPRTEVQDFMQTQYLCTWLDPYRSLSLGTIFLRFAMATLCGAVIGYERGKNRHAAGLRTHIVVCIGAASVTMLSQYIALYLNGGADPGRMGAQVVSGIGFLGAGTIMVTGGINGQKVRGLTTAAGLWASACMGLLTGLGFYEGAFFMVCFLFAVIVALNRLDFRYLKVVTFARVYIEYRSNMPFSNILQPLRLAGWHLSNLEYMGKEGKKCEGVIIDVDCRQQKEKDRELLELLRQVEGVMFVEEV